MTQATNLLEVKPKIVFNISCDHLTLSMAMEFSIHALHLQKPMKNWKALMAIQTKHPHQNQLARIGIFYEVSCHNPNSATCWRYAMATPWHGGKKQ